MPVLGGVIGGGFIKLGHGSTAAAVLVAVVPYSICLLLCSVFAIGYLTAVRRYLRAEAPEREAMERLIMISAEAIVSVLTLNKPAFAAARTRPGALASVEPTSAASTSAEPTAAESTSAEPTSAESLAGKIAGNVAAVPPPRSTRRPC